MYEIPSGLQLQSHDVMIPKGIKNVREFVKKNVIQNNFVQLYYIVLIDYHREKYRIQTEK